MVSDTDPAAVGRSLSPLDGRYVRQVGGLVDELSEWGLMRARLQVEVEWLIAMGDTPSLGEVRPLSDDERRLLRSLADRFDDDAMRSIKAIEATVKHDVKSVEYYLRERLVATSVADVVEFVHFGCTSEDINNLAYGIVLTRAMQDTWLPAARALRDEVAALARRCRHAPLLSRTHGQPATPTTMGKELAVFVARWDRQLTFLEQLRLLGKFNGAVGTFSAHVAAYPDAPWIEISRAFVEGFGLQWAPLTTQIETHDALAELFHGLARFNTILLDFAVDMWTYISFGYFRQEPAAGEVGSSTMPHKINPINFENGEANAGISNALLLHLAQKLAVSRLQRDLSDSSALRNVGVGVGHSVVAIEAVRTGLRTLAIDEDAMAADLEDAWEVLGEAVQTVMRRRGFTDPYERLKSMTRGRTVTAADLASFVRSLDLPADDEKLLLSLTPATYTGLAAQLVDFIDDPI